MEPTEHDIVLVGSSERKDYLGSRTFYLENIIKKYAPNIKLEIYDVSKDDPERIDHHSTKNLIFLPWSETIDLGWIDFFLYTKGRKILYTESHDWYNRQQDRILEIGFNLENIFNIIAFSTREQATWWNKRQFSFWGPGIFSDFFKEIEISKKQSEEKIIYVDTPWDLSLSSEPYNVIRTLNECLPIIKKNNKVKIICQGWEADWVDENIPKELDLKEIVDRYNSSDVFIVSHLENCGLPQIEAQICGTKIVTTEILSLSVALLPGEPTRELWSLGKGNEDFINAVERCLKNYDSEEVKSFSLRAFDDKKFFNNMKKDLWGVQIDF